MIFIALLAGLGLYRGWWWPIRLGLYFECAIVGSNVLYWAKRVHLHEIWTNVEQFSYGNRLLDNIVVAAWGIGLALLAFFLSRWRERRVAHPGEASATI